MATLKHINSKNADYGAAEQYLLFEHDAGTTVKGIKAEKLKRFLIPVPPISEQTRILEELEAILPMVKSL